MQAKEALLLQNTMMSANVVFVNIEWAQTRHSKARPNRNMQILGKTIAGIVHNMKPAIICMNEVGQAMILLTEEHMQQVADQIMHAWKGSATDHFALRSMFQVGAPYMTLLQCSCHRILEILYDAQGEPRITLTFLCCGSGGVNVDVTNVNAPSGKLRLTDAQRKTLLTHLLQSNSKAMPGQ